MWPILRLAKYFEMMFLKIVTGKCRITSYIAIGCNGFWFRQSHMANNRYSYYLWYKPNSLNQ